jgi:hypothetical protein
MLRSAVTIVSLLAAFAIPIAARASDTLEEYARKCDAAVGATVPDFNCDNGTLVPEGKTNGLQYGPGMKCDRPNVLNHECDPGSRFQVLVNSQDAAIVAHCRKKIDADHEDGKYGDIAVIQYGKKSGATCFYQAPVDNGDHATRLDQAVKAPSKGQSAWPWLTPKQTADIHCGECHDNGPFVRSPYLAQLADVAGAKDVLPGSHDLTFNSGEPYAFVGDDFKTWKAYKVEIKDNTCNGCHRMGVSNLAYHDTDATMPALSPFGANADPCHVVSREGGGGTSRVFGIIATLKRQCRRNSSAPTWMVPDTYAFDQANLDAANQIRECAIRFIKGHSPPGECKVTLFAGAYRSP